MILGIAGHPVSGSLSPVLQNTLITEAGIDAEYRAFDVSPDDFRRFLLSAREKNISGLNITAPLKKIGAEAADSLSPEAAAAGAVNTLVMDQDSWKGYNTDGIGFLDAVKEAGWNASVRGGTTICLGSGGAAAGLLPALGILGGCRLVIAARNVETAAELAASAGRISPGIDEVSVESLVPDRLHETVSAAALLVNTIPSPAWENPGMAPALEAVGSGLGAESLVMDLNYTRERGSTPFLDGLRSVEKRKGKSGGIRTGARNQSSSRLDGFPMLVYQGVRSLELWSGKRFDKKGLAARLDAAIRG